MSFETGFSKPETDRKRPKMIRIFNKISIQNPPENFSGFEPKSVGFCVVNSNGSRNRISTLKGPDFSGLVTIRWAECFGRACAVAPAGVSSGPLVGTYPGQGAATFRDRPSAELTLEGY